MRQHSKFVLMTTLLVTVSAWNAFGTGAECLYCGMTRSRFPHSWVELRQPDGDSTNCCSLHCAAVHMALHPKETPAQILVGDYPSGALIDADRAHWVLGGDVPGVMTRRAKWAFRDSEAAALFRKNHGGQEATFDDVIRAAFEDMRADTLMIQQRRRNESGLPAPSGN